MTALTHEAGRLFAEERAVHRRLHHEQSVRVAMMLFCQKNNVLGVLCAVGLVGLAGCQVGEEEGEHLELRKGQTFAISVLGNTDIVARPIEGDADIPCGQWPEVTEEPTTWPPYLYQAWKKDLVQLQSELPLSLYEEGKLKPMCEQACEAEQSFAVYAMPELVDIEILMPPELELDCLEDEFYAEIKLEVSEAIDCECVLY